MSSVTIDVKSQIVVNINIVYFLDAFETGVLEAKRNQNTQTKRKQTTRIPHYLPQQLTYIELRLFHDWFAVLKKEVRITFTPEDVDGFRKQSKEIDNLKLEASHNCIARIKYYIIDKIKGFRKVTPKDVMVRNKKCYFFYWTYQ